VRQKIKITKASGTTAPFSSQKLRKSLRRSGADEPMQISLIMKGHCVNHEVDVLPEMVP
jgi:transcriptional regulator NrdR family protein